MGLIGKKREVDEKCKATQTARKQVENDCKAVEKLVKSSITEKNKPKLVEALNKISVSYENLKTATKELEDVEDDKEKDFEKKKSTEIDICQKTLSTVPTQLEAVKEKSELKDDESIKSVIGNILDDKKTESSKSNGGDNKDKDKNEEDDEVSKTEDISEKLEDEDSEEAAGDDEYESGEEYQELNETHDDTKAPLKPAPTTNHPPSMSPNSNQKLGTYQALEGYTAQQDSDLSFKKGESITIVSFGDGGWWEGMNAKGEKGLVPSNFLEKVEEAAASKKKEETRDEADDGDESSDTEYYEYGEGEEDDDEEDDDDEDEDEDEESNGGTAAENKSSPLKSSPKKDLNKTSDLDISHALEGGPSGFRPSTSAALLNNDHSEYSYISALHPKLSPTGYHLRDLFWDDKLNGMRTRDTKVLKSFRLIIARNVPLPAKDVDVLCRYVSIALSNGNKILTNIMTVKATWTEADPKTWKFSPKATGLLPVLLDGFGLVRYPLYETDLSLLIEFNIAYHRPKSGDKGTISCGHVHLKLCSDYTTPTPIGNKEYEVGLMGGTPFEKDVTLDPAVTGDLHGGTSGSVKSLAAKKQAVLTIKIGDLNKEEKQLASYLPHSIVMSVALLQFVVFYRQILAVELIKGQKIHNIKAISSPFLANFPIAMDTPDLMDLLRNEWTEMLKNMKKNEKKDQPNLRNSFKSLFLQTVYPIMYSYALPKFALNDQESQSERWRLLKELVLDTRKSPLALVTSSSIQFKPFLMEETIVDIMNPYIAAALDFN